MFAQGNRRMATLVRGEADVEVFLEREFTSKIDQPDQRASNQYFTEYADIKEHLKQSEDSHLQGGQEDMPNACSCVTPAGD